jgi:acetoin utilization deacetylase AcuC-like enzyme
VSFLRREPRSLQVSAPSQSQPVSCYVSPIFGEHEQGPDAHVWHPERPERYTAVLRAIDAAGAAVRNVDAPSAAREDVERIHDARYLDALDEACREGGGRIDPDTGVNWHSLDAALAAAGAAVAAVDGALDGREPVAFCAGRPPGHHAERSHAMGFCLLNHAAIAAAHARARGAARVAVLDWDVHHGNGTQHAFYADPDVLYVSLHQAPFYPFTGAEDERGEGPGEGATVNVPLPAGTSEDAYLTRFSEIALPALRAHGPDLLVVSAGFDAHRDDPLTDLCLSSGAFVAMARELAGIGSGQIYVLEGGYDLAALEAGTTLLLRELAR